MRDFSHFFNDTPDSTGAPSPVGRTFHFIGAHKRISYSLASAVAFAGAAAGLSLTGGPAAPAASRHGTSQPVSQSIVSPATPSEQPAAAQPDNQPAAPQATPSDQTQGGQSSSISTSITSVNGNTHMTVNGQDIPVPTNGVTQQTVDTGNGQATVTINSNSSQGNSDNQTGGASNANSTSLNVNVSSGSADSGGAASSQMNMDTDMNGIDPTLGYGPSGGMMMH